ncbi:plasmid mobilization relaxosome protein MobC [Empedobacter stercoris]|uniref:plasmid mobilization relaxosome protein MobC n=1 Tax=Empedobacter stercoris TaxID=1628248 RepID=UPI0016627B1E|nr:plasmid mobilization relaxosome protein MobC [Empedobacter stercoris]MCA4809821.1 plasmid mobilization relaxosome protein MobC [Empedobacter stercoris]QNT13947.1 plasmid mobilization relaxosome protein MobC [Empedobacter stercoris]
MRDKFIQIRVSEKEKNEFLKIASERELSLTDLILTDVLKLRDKTKHRKILNLINQENFDYSKVSTNINQVAKYVNTNQKIDENTLKEFNNLLRELIILKNKANDLAYKYVMEL